MEGAASPVNPTLTHLALHVTDLEACIDFYRDYCGMSPTHDRTDPASHTRVVWLSEPGRADDFIIVLIGGGPAKHQADDDFSHLGFALASRGAIDGIADKARRAGCLVWEPRDEPYPVGYYCGVRDPDGRFVEFSYGQPLGPGAARRPE